MLKRVVAKARRMFSPVNRVGGRSFADVNEASEQQLFVRCETLDEFSSYLRSNWDTHLARLQLERDLVLPSFAGFWITGFCAVCGSDRRFFVDFACARDSDLSTRVPNWRELLTCESCKLPNRARAMLDFIDSVSADAPYRRNLRHRTNHPALPSGREPVSACGRQRVLARRDGIGATKSKRHPAPGPHGALVRR